MKARRTRMSALLSALLSLVACASAPDPKPPLAVVVENATLGSSYGIIGDAGVTGGLVDRLQKSLLGFQTRKLILPGDNLYNPNWDTYAEVWEPWLGAGFEFSVVAIGNHNTTHEEEIAYFRLPRDYYAADEPNALFLVLNSDRTTTSQEQAGWLRKELERAGTHKSIFVVYHHPPATFTDDHTWEERREFHEAVSPVLRAFSAKITALILGHDHIASLYDLSGIPTVVSGAAVQTRRAQIVNGSTGGWEVTTKWVFKGAPAWARLELHSNDDVWVRFIDTRTNDLICSALVSARPIRLDGCD